MDSPPRAPATTPRSVPTALLRAQNSIAALPHGRGVLALRQIIFTSKTKKRVEVHLDLYVLCGCGAPRMALPATHIAALRSCSLILFALALVYQ